MSQAVWETIFQANLVTGAKQTYHLNDIDKTKHNYNREHMLQGSHACWKVLEFKA